MKPSLGDVTNSGDVRPEGHPKTMAVRREGLLGPVGQVYRRGGAPTGRDLV